LRSSELRRDKHSLDRKSRPQKLFHRAHTLGDEELLSLTRASSLEVAC
jgi:hypothetical protein